MGGAPRSFTQPYKFAYHNGRRLNEGSNSNLYTECLSPTLCSLTSMLSVTGYGIIAAVLGMASCRLSLRAVNDARINNGVATKVNN